MSRRPNHGRPLAVGPLCSDIVSRIVPPDRLRLTFVQIAWPEIATAAIANSVWPASIQRDVLTLVVADNQWLAELVYLQAELLRAIRSTVPQAGVANLRTRVGVIPPRVLEPPQPLEP